MRLGNERTAVAWRLSQGRICHKYASCSEMAQVLIWLPPFVKHMKPRKSRHQWKQHRLNLKVHPPLPRPPMEWVIERQVARCLIRVETNSWRDTRLSPVFPPPSLLHLRKGKYSEGRFSDVTIKACPSIAIEIVLRMQSSWVNSCWKWNATCLYDETAVAERLYSGVSSSSSNPQLHWASKSAPAT